MNSLDCLGKMYSDGPKLETMQAAAYHQQITDEPNGSKWTIFEGQLDKDFIHTAWFVPLTTGKFYTFKEYLINHIQETYNYGKDIALQNVDLSVHKPKLQVSLNKDDK